MANTFEQSSVGQGLEKSGFGASAQTAASGFVASHQSEVDKLKSASGSLKGAGAALGGLFHHKS